AESKTKQIPFPPLTPVDPRDPEADKKTGAELAQWMATTQKIKQFNKKQVMQKVAGAKTRQEAASAPEFKTYAAVIGNCKTPEEPASQPRGPPLKVPQHIFDAHAELTQESQKFSTLRRSQLRALKNVKEPLTNLKENRPSVITPNKTTFTLPENDGTTNTTF